MIRKIVHDVTGRAPDLKDFGPLLNAIAGKQIFDHMRARVSIDRSIVGIGAPAEVFVAPLKQRMEAEAIIPTDHDVGNAVGAMCSPISESLTLQVHPKDYKFLVFSQFSSPIEHSHVEEAVSSAKRSAEQYVREKVEGSAAGEVKVRMEVIERKFADGHGKDMKSVKWIDVKATATGKPKLH